MDHLSRTSYKIEDWISPGLHAFLPEQQRELLQDSLDLLRFHGMHIHLVDQQNTEDACHCAMCEDNQKFHDYAFIVFPAAKCFEGFLKHFFVEMKIITKERYKSRDLRIGRSLNPDLPEKFRNEEWYYDDISRLCEPYLARDIWQVWLDGRNHLFHYFPDDRYQLTYHEAADILHRFIRIMEACIVCDSYRRMVE